MADDTALAPIIRAERADGGDFFPTVIMPSDVAALQTAIKADRDLILSEQGRLGRAWGPHVQPDYAEWAAMRTRVDAYLAESPAWLSTKSQYERGEAIQKDLATWHDRLRRLGSTIGPAPSPSGPTESPAQALWPAALIALAIALVLRR